MPSSRPTYCRTTGALISACRCIRCAQHPAPAHIQAITAIHERPHRSLPIVAITYESPILTVSGYATPAELRQMARQLITIANDADQGASGVITYEGQAA